MFCMARESAMAVQDQGGCSISNTIFAAGGRSSMDGRLQQKFYSGDDHSPKVRKPYTITKQRERWTEEEHKKFIEALKLYGRAWRRIEEHVGTKTAVQIRSHAQKFFSKVVRDSTASNMRAVEPIEIPPPRPKRKPVHPYPRKPVDDCNKGTPVSEQPIRSASPIFSVSERENQSPTSVLSAVGSDAMGSTDSNPLNGSLSPVSSPAGGNRCSVLVSEPNPLPEENGSPSPIQLMAGSNLNEHFPQNSGLSPEDNAAEEAASGRSIKLFGRTVLVTDTQRPSSPPMELREAQPSDINTGEPTQLLPWNLALAVSEPVHMGYTWNYSPEGAHGGLSSMQFQNENSNTAESGPAAPLPWWTICRGVSIPFLSLHEGESAKSHGESKFGDVQEKEIRKEGSWTGSNTGSMNEEENSDKNGDAESNHCRLTFNKEKKQDLAPKKQSSEKMSLCERQMSQNRSKKGFVPYKRCLSDGETQSSAAMGDEREGQRFRLCL